MIALFLVFWLELATNIRNFRLQVVLRFESIRCFVPWWCILFRLLLIIGYEVGRQSGLGGLSFRNDHRLRHIHALIKILTVVWLSETLLLGGLILSLFRLFELQLLFYWRVRQRLHSRVIVFAKLFQFLVLLGCNIVKLVVVLELTLWVTSALIRLRFLTHQLFLHVFDGNY